MRAIFAVLSGGLLFMPATMAQDVGATLVAKPAPQRFGLGGPGGWDYLSMDSARHRLYVSRGDHVVVVDVVGGKSIGEIPNTPGVHGIALAPMLHEWFISDGKSDTVTVFDPDTLKTVGEIKLDASNPDAILYDAASQRVMTFNGNSENATLIDAATRTIVGNIALDGKPEFGVSDGHGRVFVNIENKGEISAIDPKAATVVATWSLGNCENPSGLAIDKAHRRLFSVCANGRMTVTDADSGRHVADVPIGAGPDAARFDAARGLAFSSNGRDGTLTVVHEDDPDHYRVLANEPTQKSARTMALDDTTHRIYLSAADFDPLPTNAPPRTRPPMKADSFAVLVVDEDSITAK
jgi:DNA-binding beta-propeller fold protein YncE